MEKHCCILKKKRFHFIHPPTPTALLAIGLLWAFSGLLRATKIDAPIEIRLAVPAFPSPGGWGALEVEVRSAVDAPGTRVRVEPVEGLEFGSAAPEWVVDLGAGRPVSFRVALRTAREGSLPVRVTAECRSGRSVFGRSARLFLHTRGNRTTVFSRDPEAPPDTAVCGTEPLPFVPNRPTVAAWDGKRQPATVMVEALPSSAVISGAWFYRDREGVDRPLGSARVEIRTSAENLLNTVYTDATGHFQSGPVEVGSGTSLHAVVYATDDLSCHVRTPGGTLFTARTSDALVSGSAYDFGAWTITDDSNRMAYYIFDKIGNEAFRFLDLNTGWRNEYNLPVVWSAGSADGTYYDGYAIHLLAEDRWDGDVILHEFGHFVMDKIYVVYPSTPNCNPHFWGYHSSRGCAWSEGWATFLEAAIQGRPTYEDTEDQSLLFYLEPPDPEAHHAEDEGAVCASLWDIFDTAVEDWDSIGLGISGIWNVVTDNSPSNVLDFYDFWRSSPFGSDAQVQAVLGHHKIISAPEPCEAIVRAIPAAGLSESQSGTFRFFCIEIPLGATAFSASLSGGAGDADLYAKVGAQPTVSIYDARSITEGTSTEQISLPTPVPGVWYLGVLASPSYDGAGLTVTYTDAAGARVLSAAHVADSELWWSRLSLANTGTASTAVQLCAYAPDGRPLETYSLPALAASGGWSAGLEDILSPMALQDAWIRVTALAPLRGVVEFGNRSVATHVSLPLAREGSQTFFFPYVTTAFGYYTGITLVNPGTAAAALTLTGFDESGSTVSTVSGTIPPGGKYVRLVEGVFGAADAAAIRFVRIQSDRPLTGFELFGNLSLPGLAGLPATLASAAAGTSVPMESAAGEATTYRLVYNDIPTPADTYTGMTCSNAGEGACTLHIRLLNAEGNVLSERDWPSPVGPFEQVTRSVQDLVGQPVGSSAAYVEITAPSPLLGFSLFLENLDDPAHFLFDGIPATADSAATLFFPVVKTGADWAFNRVGLTNRDSRPNPFTLKFYSASGVLVSTLSSVLAPYGRWSWNLDPLQLGTAVWFVAEGAYPMVGDLLYVSASGDRMGAYLGQE